MSKEKDRLKDEDYRRLAEFRYRLRCFLEFSEQAAVSHGVTPQQHQALLVIRGCPSAQIANIAYLAERLRIRHNTAVELVKRLELAGLISRRSGLHDKRNVLLELTEEGYEKIRSLSSAHHQELENLRPEVIRLFSSLNLEEK